MSQVKLKVKYTPNSYANKYSDIFTKGYFDLELASKSEIEFENATYKLTKIYFECTETLEIKTIYFEHVNSKNSTQYIYVKLPIEMDTAKSTTPDKYNTYTDVRGFLRSLQYADNQDTQIVFKIAEGLLNESNSVNTTSKYSFTHSQSGDAVTMIELTKLMVNPINPKIEYKMISGFTKSKMTNTNILDKNNTNPKKEGFTEGFVEGATNYSCKRKGTIETAVINNTIMGESLATKLIESQKSIMITAVVMFFICLLVVSLYYLSTINTEDTEVKPPIAPGGGSAILGGMGEFCANSEQKTLNGFLFIIGISCVILNLYGAMYLKDMYLFYAGIVFTGITAMYYIRYVYKELTIFDVELEHVILYSREKPIVKWFAMSAHYIWFSLMSAMSLSGEKPTTDVKSLSKNPQATEDKSVSLLAFRVLLGLYLFVVLISYLLYKYYEVFFKKQTIIDASAVPTKQSIFERVISIASNIIFGVPLAIKAMPIIILVFIATLSGTLLSYTDAQMNEAYEKYLGKGRAMNTEVKTPNMDVKMPSKT